MVTAMHLFHCCICLKQETVYYSCYRPQRSCEGYVLTPVCDSVCRGGVLSQHTLQVVSQHALQQVSRGCLLGGGACSGRGACSGGGFCSRRVVCNGGFCSRWVPALGGGEGVPALGGCSRGLPGGDSPKKQMHPTGMHSCLKRAVLIKRAKRR